MTLPLRVPISCFVIILCCALLGSVSTALASPQLHQHAVLQQWSLANGLPDGQVNDAVEGPNGFLWVATDRGLSRFDGTQFVNVPMTPHRAPIAITHLAANTNALWLGTAEGLKKLSLDQYRVTPVTLPTNDASGGTNITQLSIDSSGRILVATEHRLFRGSASNDTFEAISLTYNNQAIKHINYIYQDNDWFWLNTKNSGVYVWDGFSHDVFALNKQNPIASEIPGKQLFSVLRNKQHLWLATDAGLLLLNNDYRLERPPQHLANLKQVKSIVQDNNNNLILSSLSGVFKSDSNRLMTLHQKPVNRTVVTQDGSLFSLSDRQGLLQLPAHHAPAGLASKSTTKELPSFSQIKQNIAAATQHNRHDWWLASEPGLLHYNADKQEILSLNHYPNAPFTVQDMQLFAGQLYVLNTLKKLYRYDIKHNTWRALPYPEPLSASSDPVQLTTLAGSLWLHSNDVAIRIDQSGKLSSPMPQINHNTLFNHPLHIDSERIGAASYAFQFTVPFASYPEHLHYRYRLTGEPNPQWHTLAPGQHSLQLGNLTEGQYQLEAQASYDGEQWSTTATAPLHIQRTTWPDTVVWITAGLLLLVLFTLYWWRQRQQYTALSHQAEQLQRQAQGLRYSRYQYWEWDLTSGELTRQHIWAHCPSFPIDGVRIGFSGSQSNVHPDDLPRLQQSLNEHITGHTDTFECRYRLDNQGNWVWVLDRGQLRPDTDDKTMFGTLSDISSLVSSEERINMLASSITNISDGVCIFDRYFRKREVNNAFEKITGNDRDSVLGQPLSLSCYPDSFVNQIKRTVINDGCWRGELTDVKADNSEFLMELTLDAVRDDNNEVSLIVASFSDITERRHTEGELRRLSNTDTLTGLPNRSYFQVSHSNLVRKKVSHTLLLFDLDDFKKVNDSLGHEVGDELLCQVAERLMNIGRKQDTLYRLGGDEFGLLIEDSTDINLIGNLGNQVNQKISEPYIIQQQEVVIGSSIGIVLYPHDGNTSQALLQKADMAMYHAKQRGGNCYQFFSQSMNENAVKRLQLENELRGALKADNICVYYQPKIEVNTGHIAGLEALARIERKDGTLISPADFIPLAEETGLIIPLGEAVLRQSCRDMKRFMRHPGAPKSIAINLSARQFMQSSLALQIEEVLREEALHPRHVEFEITEGMVMNDPERAITMMENLSDMGVKLALDDFGTGYSSLSYLKRFPMNSLKVDKAFVDDITVNDKDRNMVASIIAMAHNLGLKVVAEGVETQAQLETLKSLKCEYIQGFYYAKPMPAEALIQFIKHHHTDRVSMT